VSAGGCHGPLGTCSVGAWEPSNRSYPWTLRLLAFSRGQEELFIQQSNPSCLLPLPLGVNETTRV
jgi:hypothetical protein